MSALEEIADVLRALRDGEDRPSQYQQAQALAQIGGILDRSSAEEDVRPRTWVGEALAAYDQGLETAGSLRDYQPPPDFWISRAQAAAAIASAQQARIANLIAWKALQVQMQAGTAAGETADGDEISAEIRAGLGLA